MLHDGVTVPAVWSDCILYWGLHCFAFSWSVNESGVQGNEKLTFRLLMSTIGTYRTANLQSFILYIYSTNIGTEYFKHGVYCPFFPLQNAVCFIILTYLVPVLFTFYVQGVLK